MKRRHWRRALAGSGLLLLLSACSAIDDGPEEGERAFIEQRRSDALAGMWALDAEDGEVYGSLRLAPDPARARALLATLLPVDEDPVTISLAFRRGELAGTSAITSGTSISIALRPRGALSSGWSPFDPRWRGELRAAVQHGDDEKNWRASRLTRDCPICTSEASMADAFCARCGYDLQSNQKLDVRVAWKRGAVEAFDAKALQSALALRCKTRHKVVVTNCSFRMTDQRLHIGRIALWAVLGVFSGLQSWEYTLDCTISVDDKSPVYLRDVKFELDFFDRNEGFRELFLIAVSWLYPAPLLEDDPEVTAPYAVDRIVDACLQVMDRP